MTSAQIGDILWTRVEGGLLRSSAMKVMRLSWTVVLNGEREVTMILLHSSAVVFLTSYSRTADPVMPFPPVMRATFAIFPGFVNIFHD